MEKRVSQDYGRILRVNVMDGKNREGVYFQKEIAEGKYIIKKHTCPICSGEHFETLGEHVCGGG